MTLINLAGNKFGRLTVLKRAENIGKQPSWLCLCDCGKTKIVRGDHLRRNLIQSCGCLEEENRSCGANYKHGGKRSRLYNIYCGMKKRCYNQNSNAFPNYGGRGISMCAEWYNDFPSFRNWALNHNYASDLSIDRIDVNGNYEPSNCRWADAQQQAQNRRPQKR